MKKLQVAASHSELTATPVLQNLSVELNETDIQTGLISDIRLANDVVFEVMRVA